MFSDCHQIKGFNTQYCCESCHEDWEDYAIEMCSLDIDGLEMHVCCKVKSFYAEGDTKCQEV